MRNCDAVIVMTADNPPFLARVTSIHPKTIL